MDYVDYYKKLIEECGCEAEILFANQAEAVLTRVKNVLCCDIHTRFRTKRRLAKAGAEKVLALDDLLTASVNGSGYNEKYGLLGSNKSSEDKVKLFPRNGAEFVDALAAAMRKATGKNIECMIYGDGAFRDPVGKIWELADPVVSPACTAGLVGKPNELKIKYLADNDFAGLNGEELRSAVEDSIRHKDADLKGSMASQGTTPRQLTDLIARSAILRAAAATRVRRSCSFRVTSTPTPKRNKQMTKYRRMGEPHSTVFSVMHKISKYISPKFTRYMHCKTGTNSIR